MEDLVGWYYDIVMFDEKLTIALFRSVASIVLSYKYPLIAR